MIHVDPLAAHSAPFVVLPEPSLTAPVSLTGDCGSGQEGCRNMIEFSVNGRAVRFGGDDRTPLLWVLRDDLGLTGTKYGCGIGQCGACTVHVDGAARRACVAPVTAVAGLHVTTIEGLARGERLHPVQAAWLELDVPQCGYCQAGQIMATVAFLAATPRPSDADIDAGLTNICRCGTYPRIRKAVHRAAGLLAEAQRDE
jgi:isoquinoline 1-oxidoreductase alpha subunit